MWPRSRKQLPSLRGPLPPRASLGDNSKEAVFFLLKRELGGDSHLFPGSSLLRTVTQAHWLPPLWGRKALLGLGGRTVNRPDCIWRGSRKEVSQPQRVSWADPGTLAPTGPLCLSVKVGIGPYPRVAN